MPASTLVISFRAAGMPMPFSMAEPTMSSVPIVGRLVEPAAARSLKTTVSVGGSISEKMTCGWLLSSLLISEL